MCLELKRNDPAGTDYEIGAEVDGDGNFSNFMDDIKLALLERSLEGNTHLEAMIIKFALLQRGSPLTTDGLNAFAVGISHTRITSLELKFDFSKTFQQALFFGLRQSHSLKSLTIQSSSLSMKSLSYLFLPPNELQMAGLQGSDGTTQIEEFTIGQSVMLNASSEVKFFAKSLQNGVSLQRLTMHSNHISDNTLIEFTKHLSPSSSITELNLSDNDITHVGLQSLLDRVCDLGAFTSLDVSENVRIGYRGIKAIGVMLRRAQLTDLTVGDCIISEEEISDLDIEWVLEDPSTRDEAFEELAAGLRHNETLEQLDLRKNCMNAKEALLVLQATVDHPSLEYLRLSHNEDIGFHGLRMIGEILPDLTLSTLDLRRCVNLYNPISDDDSTDNDVEDSVINRFAKAEQRAGSAVVAGITRNTHLYHLYRDAFFGTVWTDQINFFLDLNRCKRHQLLCGQPPASIWPLVFQKLKFKKSHIFYYLREQPGLVQLSVPATKKRKMET